MAFWPDVKHGDKVQYHMVLENNLRHMVNRLNGFGAGNIAAPSGDVVKVQVWNASGAAMVAGQPVTFDDSKAMCGDALPAVMVTNVDKPWGVCTGYIAPNETGGCIVAGPATVSLSGSTGDYAEPVVNGTGFTRAATGTARILYAGATNAVILLGCMAMENYNGPFAVTFDAAINKVNITAGYISCNGTFSTVPAAQLTPETGTLCVYSELDAYGAWSNPVVMFATPDKYHYPIGSCMVTGSGETQSVAVCCYRVTVAIIIDSEECPITAITNGSNMAGSN